MSAPKRADVLANMQKVLAKHYKPIKPVERPVLEELLYACCLEDSRPEAADECFARLQESFFDWNEVRVTTVSELSEVLRGLHDPQRSATLIKQTLHSVFEALYDFDLESLRKQNLGAAVKQLQGYRGTTPFGVNYAVQKALGGHAIPVSQAGMEIMRFLGLVSDKEKDKSSDAAGSVPGLERAVPKNKGVEFASLLQQFAADYAGSPFGNAVRSILLEIDPDAKGRFPKRPGRKGTAGEATEPELPAGESKPDKKKVPPRPSKPVSKSAPKAVPKPVTKKKTAKKTPPPAKPSKKLTGHKTGKKSISKKAVPSGKKSASKQLARRKPR
jgi:endonuclease-3